MCTPTVAIMGAGALVSAYGAAKQQSAANKAAEYNARVSERQAEVSELQAQDVERRGETEARAQVQKAEGVKGAQRAGFGASGVQVDAGSTLDTTTDTAVQGTLDAMTIKHNAAKDAYTLRQSGESAKYSAAGARAGKQSASGAAGLSLLGSASQIGSSYIRNKR